MLVKTEIDTSGGQSKGWFEGERSPASSSPFSPALSPCSSCRLLLFLPRSRRTEGVKVSRSPVRSK